MSDEPDIGALSPDQVLAAFLDALRDKNRDKATEMIHELRYRVWAGSPLPRDVRPNPAEQAELRRLSAMWRQHAEQRAVHPQSLARERYEQAWAQKEKLR